MWLKLFAVQSKHNIIATVQTAFYYGAEWQPIYTSKGCVMHDDGRSLAKSLDFTFIGLNDVLGQTPIRQQL